MSPEDRAHPIALQLFPTRYGQDFAESLAEYDRVKALIATAIREAEDAKLERAILFCDGEAKAKDLPGDDPRFYAGRREAGRRLGRLVRSLKSQEP
jgi:hypothetical protein